MTSPYWRHYGAGTCPVVALHCSLAYSGAWRGVAQHLAAKVSVQAMDLPGHGQSPPPSPGQDIAELSVAWAGEKLTQPVHLFGHSFGAYVALRLAQAYPEKILSLSLYEPVFFAALRDADFARFESYRAEMSEIADLLDQGNSDEAARRFVRAWGDGRRWADLPDAARAGFRAGMPWVLAAQGALIDDQVELLARLSDIEVPVLLMDGARSHPTMAPVQNALANRIGSSRRVTLASAGHMGVITHPQEVAQEFARQLYH